MEKDLDIIHSAEHYIRRINMGRIIGISIIWVLLMAIAFSLKMEFWMGVLFSISVMLLLCFNNIILYKMITKSSKDETVGTEEKKDEN